MENVRDYNIRILHDDGNHSRCNPADNCQKETLTEALKWELMDSEFPITRIQALERLMRDACVYGRKFYTSDGHLIPLSSYLPRKGDPLDTLS